MVFHVHPNWYLMGNVMSWWIFWRAGLVVFVGSGPMLLGFNPSLSNVRELEGTKCKIF